PQIREARALSRWVKSVSDAPVVWGGVFPSLAPEVVLRDPAVDIVVQGEGERAAPELAAALSGGVSLKEVQGLWFKEGDAILRSEPRPFGDLASYPRLPYGLVDVPKYNFSLASGPEAGRLKLVMETSRGCSYACVYCYNPIFYRNSWRARTAEHVVDEIDFLHRAYGAASIDFLDDDLFERPERVVAVAEGLLARGVGISWLANGVTILSLDRLSDDDLRTLRKSGLAMVNFGAESGSDRLLERMGRGARVADIERINRRLSGIGIRPAFYFSTGMEGETEEELRSTVDLMLRLTETNPEAKIIASFCLTPFPGTALTRAAERAGAALPRTLE
ncbi:MAG: B12-binding domain-containing radical SAM protein, partial [Candidatus Methylomirabilis sp.]|nr:B12-binding domain-containing radical SAM protein [Deltaproteobacteria bacterium]